jgi:MoxR-like ATPase
VNQVVSVEQILRAQEAVREVYMDEKKKYILDIVFLPLEKYKLADLKPLISFGASPRGSINLANAVNVMLYKIVVMLSQDVRAVVHDVCVIEVGITEAEAENTSVDIINKIINEVEVPFSFDV